MDAAAPLRPQLPALAFAESDKAKKDEEAYQQRQPGAASLPPTSHIAATTSPAYSYPSGPPPPYSHHATATTHAPTSHPAIPTATPPLSSLAGTDSRRTSSDEKEIAAALQPTRQSLPSISEALGVDNQTAYHQTLQNAAPTPASILPLQTPQLKSHPDPASPVPAMRSYPDTSTYKIGAVPTTSPSHAPDASRPIFPDTRPALHLQTAQSSTSYHASPQPGTFSQPTSNSSPVFERGHQQGPATAPTTFTYGYTPYPPRYRPAAQVPTNPIYQPSINNAGPWKSESSTYAVQDRNYGDSVKRHLDLYDLESALNDVASTSNFLGDFANRYGTLMHQAPRTGPAAMPSIVEVEDMISKSRLQTEALIKIRDTVLAQQAAHDQEAAEQRQQKMYGSEMSVSDTDGKDGYTGADAKKRRGRAAPPGRCHSCNRAETPEWRRGPDGARTLCNACGLHYAKLTRKQNNNLPKPAPVGSSNLRPKESMP